MGDLDAGSLGNGDADAAAAHAEPAVGSDGRDKMAHGVHAARQQLLDDDGVVRKQLADEFQHRHGLQGQVAGHGVGAGEQRCLFCGKTSGDGRAAVRAAIGHQHGQFG